MAVKSVGLSTKGLRSEFFSKFDAQEVHYQTLSTRIPSTTDPETYRFLGSVQTMREWGIVPEL